MSLLKFVLNPRAVSRVYDAVLCLAKFSEMVSLEATEAKLVLSTLNSSKSAYASFSFEKDIFFDDFAFDSFLVSRQTPVEGNEVRFTCQLYNKALLSVFKGRVGDNREKDTAIERCECQLQDEPDKAECKLVVKLVCRHGVIKTYKLSYESTEVMHALFNQNAAKNTWTISASALRSFAEYFGAKTEHLDISTENGRTTFMSYTEKLMNGKDVLKQPLQTSITVDNLDFEEFQVNENLHIGINVKDFKAIVAHAETLKTNITSAYSFPTRPMQLTYSEHGMHSAFTLMTIGEYRGPSTTPAPPVAERPAAQADPRPTPRTVSEPTPLPRPSRSTMPPPSQPASRSFTRELQSQRAQRPSPPPPKASLDPESLFIPMDEDEDRQWGERNYDEEEDTVGWSASASRTSNVRDSREPQKSFLTLSPYPAWPDEARSHLPPTQRLSEIENLFGD